MLTVRVVHIRKFDGNANDLYKVCQPNILANPFSIKQHGRDKSLILYKKWLNLQYMTNNRTIINELDRLAAILKENNTITLGCLCSPKPCHADLIAIAIKKLANKINPYCN